MNLKQHQEYRAKVAAEAEREQQQLAVEITELRRSIANLQAQEPGDGLEAAQARINKQALALELQDALQRLIERQRDLRRRHEVVERNLDKQAKVLEKLAQ